MTCTATKRFDEPVRTVRCERPAEHPATDGPDGLRTFDCVMFDLATERPGWQTWCRWWWRYDGRESGWLGWGRPVLVKANRWMRWKGC